MISTAILPMILLGLALFNAAIPYLVRSQTVQAVRIRMMSYLLSLLFILYGIRVALPLIQAALRH